MHCPFLVQNVVERSTHCRFLAFLALIVIYPCCGLISYFAKGLGISDLEFGCYAWVAELADAPDLKSQVSFQNPNKNVSFLSKT
jgi:hypothetical protein